MARVRLCSYLEGISGKLDDAIYYTRRGTSCMRKIVVQRNPDTILQRHNRTCFREAVHAWQVLPVEEKMKWNRKARNKQASGYNLYISAFMKQNGTSSVADGPCSKVRSAHESTSVSVPISLRLPSVPKPYSLRDTTLTPCFVPLLSAEG